MTGSMVIWMDCEEHGRVAVPFLPSPCPQCAVKTVGYVHKAWTRYQNALRNREHGGVAADRLIAEVGDAIGRSQYEFQEKRDG